MKAIFSELALAKGAALCLAFRQRLESRQGSIKTLFWKKGRLHTCRNWRLKHG